MRDIIDKNDRSIKLGFLGVVVGILPGIGFGFLIGSLLGSVIPGIGTVVGGIIGMALGGIAGAKVLGVFGAWLGRAIDEQFPPSPALPPPAPRISSNASALIPVGGASRPDAADPVLALVMPQPAAARSVGLTQGVEQQYPSPAPS